MKKMRVPCLLACLYCTWLVNAQDPAAPAIPQLPPGISLPGMASREPEIKPYDKVITKDAKSDEGVFTVHRIKEKVYYEIPKDQLNREFLWVTQIAKTTNGPQPGCWEDVLFDFMQQQ
ncbi:MAG: DUF5118 domain-containing protein [Blastocatellia bacterium]